MESEAQKTQKKQKTELSASSVADAPQDEGTTPAIESASEAPPCITPIPETERTADTEQDSDEEMSDEEWTQRQTLFANRCQQLWTLRHDSQTQSDNLIVTMSSAFLALSVAYLKDVVPIERAIWFPLVALSWLLLIGAIGAIFLSFSASREAMDDDQERSIRLYLKDEKDAFDGEEAQTLTKKTEGYNKTAAICFLAALVSFGIFSGVNVMREQQYQKEQATITKTEEKEKAAQEVVDRKAKTQEQRAVLRALDAMSKAQQRSD